MSDSLIKRVAARYIAANLDFGFDDTGPVALSPVSKAIHEVESKVGGYAEMLYAHRLIKSPGVSLLAAEHDGIRYWNRKAWLVVAKASNASGARTTGLKVQQNLVGKKALSAADPHLHQLPLYVVAQDGEWTRLDPLPEKIKVKTTPDLNEQKHKVVAKGDDFFGPGSTRISGSEERGYTLAITPKKKEHKGLFRDTTVKGTSLDDLSAKLDAAVAKVEAFLAR